MDYYPTLQSDNKFKTRFGFDIEKPFYRVSKIDYDKGKIYGAVYASQAAFEKNAQPIETRVLSLPRHVNAKSLIAAMRAPAAKILEVAVACNPTQ